MMIGVLNVDDLMTCCSAAKEMIGVAAAGVTESAFDEMSATSVCVRPSPSESRIVTSKVSSAFWLVVFWTTKPTDLTLNGWLAASVWKSW